MNQKIGRGQWLLAICLAAATPVYAAPGDGINLGQTTISPALQLNVSYDSNVKHQSADLAMKTNPSQEVLGSAVFEARPSLGVSFKNSDLKMQASVEDLMKIFTASEIRNLSYFDDILANGEADLFSDRRIGLVVRDDFSRHNYLPRGVVDPTTSTRKRDYNNFLVEGRYSPGSALDLNLGVHWYIDVQDALASGAINPTGPSFKNEFGGVARGKWKFFPLTSLLAELDYSSGKWYSVPTCTNPVPSQECEAAFKINDAEKSSVTQWSALAGVSGQFSTQIQANLFLGYGGLYNLGDASADNITGLKGILGQVQLVYSPIETHNISLSFSRRFGDSAVLDYVVSDAITLAYSGLYIGRLAVNAQASLDMREQNSAEAADTSSRVDNVFSALLGADYQVTKWLTAKAFFLPTIVLSKADTGYSPANLSSDYYQNAFGFNDFVFSVGVRGIY